jgi:hypothetical protein
MILWSGLSLKLYNSFICNKGKKFFFRKKTQTKQLIIQNIDSMGSLKTISTIVTVNDSATRQFQKCTVRRLHSCFFIIISDTEITSIITV